MVCSYTLSESKEYSELFILACFHNNLAGLSHRVNNLLEGHDYSFLSCEA
jgi:hypothetical protein